MIDLGRLKADAKSTGNGRLMVKGPTLLALVAAVEALREAERLYTCSDLLANGTGCGAWVNRTRDVLARFAPEAPTP